MADDASDFDAGNPARERQLQSLDKLAKGFGTSLSGHLPRASPPARSSAACSPRLARRSSPPPSGAR